MNLTAIICTHNPRCDHLAGALAGLAVQTGLPQDAEFILLDNCSDVPLAEKVDMAAFTGFARARILREERLGLVHARIRAIDAAEGDVLVFVDDDNVLAPSYLRAALAAFAADPALGAAGGRSIPCYEVTPPDWFAPLGLSLACRDLGEVPLWADWSSGQRTYPACAPIGAGMAVRREAAAAWVAAVRGDGARGGLGRCGMDLAAGEDNDMVLTLLQAGWRVAYLPRLSLVHQIPASRLAPAYLARYAESANRSFVKVLDVHGIRPWPAIPAWTLPLRRAKAYVTTRAWRSPADRIRFRSACGLYAGQAALRAGHGTAKAGAGSAGSAAPGMMEATR